MTVSYTVDSKFGGAFTHLLFRWKGSIFKLVWPDLTIFLALYSAMSLLYRFILNEDQQRRFEKISIYCEKYGTLIPVSFVLGFYVSLVIGRWWAQYKVIPWIDTLAMWVNTSIRGSDDEERLIRRSVVRYVCLSITQCFTLISSQTKRRFPSKEHLIQAGLLMENEKIFLENIVAGIPKYQTHWIPLVWATTLIAQARADGKIVSDSWMKAIIDEINKIKDQCNLLLSFDRIRVPLVYTQVVTLAVYAYFFSCLMGRQWVLHEAASTTNKTRTAGKYGVEELDLIFPIFTILQFLFYIGWLKVAESLVNPFGDDDYDFELNWMVDRHLQVAFTIVDKMHYKTPDLCKDTYWEEIVPPELPHTLASLKYNTPPPETSTASINVSHKESEIISPSCLSLSTIAKAEIKFRKRSVIAAKKSLLLAQNSVVEEEEPNGERDIETGGAGIVNIEDEVNEINVISMDINSKP